MCTGHGPDRKRLHGLVCFLGVWLSVASSAIPAEPPVSNPATQCAEGVALFRAGKEAAALPLLEAGFAGRAEAVFDTLSDFGLCALFLGLLRDRNQNARGALEAYGPALVAFQRSGNRWLVGTTLDAIGTVYYTHRHFEPARAYFEQALAVWEEAEDFAEAGNTRRKIGETYQQQAQYNDALNAYQQALQALEKAADQPGAGIVHNNLGALYQMQGRYDEALKHYQQALTMQQNTGDRTAVGTTLSNLGALHYAKGDYVAALTHYEKALHIWRLTGARRQQGATLNNMGLLYQGQGRYEKALDRFDAALAIRREVGDRAGESTTLHNMGVAYRLMGNYDRARTHFHTSLSLARQIHDRAGEGATLNNLGLLHQAQGRYAEAFGFFEQSRVIAQEMRNRAGEGAAINNLGLVYHAQGYYEKAIEHFERALAIRREVGDLAGEGITLQNLGASYRAQGRYAQALTHYELSLGLRRQLGARAEEATTLSHLGAVYHAQGRHGEALARYSQALTIQRQVGDRSGEGATLTNIGAVYQTQGRYQEALNYFAQALTLTRQIGEPASERTILANMGVVYQSQGRYAEAVTHFERARDIALKLGDRAIEHLLNNLGLVYHVQGLYEQALPHYTQALAVAEEVGNRAVKGIALYNMSAVYEAQGHYEQALKYALQAMTIVREVGDRAAESAVHLTIGQIYQAQRQYDEAQPHLAAAVDIIETLRQGVGSNQARTQFVGRFAKAYRVLAINTLRLGRAEDAFAVSERGRARTFLDDVTSGAVLFSDNAVRELQQRERDLFAQRRAIEDTRARWQVQSTVDPKRLQALEDQRQQLDRTYATTLEQLRGVKAELAALAAGKPLRARDVQSLLPPDVTLLAYYLLDETAIAAFLLTHEAFHVLELPIAYAQLRDHIKAFLLFADLETSPPAALVDLHRALISPLLGHIRTRRLIIVPNALLHYIPFPALSDGTMYLGDRFILTLLPSASTLPFVSRKRKARETLPTPLIFGNPTTGNPGLPPLRFAEREAKRIGSLFGVDPILHDKATKRTLIKRARTAGIVHLAAHGRFNTAEPLESFIALAPGRDSRHNGHLTVREVYHDLRLTHANLVVLSACQTNVGEISNGDEVVGLARAFIFAGTPSVIATLWQVDDQATGRLMEKFYVHLRAGRSQAEALQKAQQTLRQDYPHPYYWGAFVLTGDGR